MWYGRKITETKDRKTWIHSPSSVTYQSDQLNHVISLSPIFSNSKIELILSTFQSRCADKIMSLEYFTQCQEHSSNSLNDI